MLLHAFFNTGMDVVIDRNTGEAADFEQVAAIGITLCEIIDLAFAHGLEIDRDAPGARLGDNAVEGNDGDARIAGFLHRAIQGGRRSGVDDDGVIALQNHVLDLGGLFRRLIFCGRERIGGGHHASLHGFLGDLVPALQHGLTPGIACIIVRECNLLRRSVGECAACRKNAC